MLACLQINSVQAPWWSIILAILIRTQLQTGLFIIGHDSMHRVLISGDRWRNDAVGKLCLLLYAALPYRQCLANHQRHHLAPASAEDPDSPSNLSVGVVDWYQHFMAGYLNPVQMGVLLSAWAVLTIALSKITPTAAANVLLFCTLPLLLSSLQLFIVGTYLPHRAQLSACGPTDPQSLDLPPWLSLLACFHFGYHREHHDNPGLPWFALPAARLRAKRLTLSWQPR